MSGRTLLITSLFLLAACLTTGVATSTTTALARLRSFPTAQAQNPADIAAIEAYSKQMDAYVKRNSRGGRFFGDTANYEEANAPARWQEFRNKRALQRAEVYSAATAWTNPAGELLVADFSLSSPSGDWAQYNTYYYRSDGTLAKLHSELRTFMGDLVVIRDRLYDPNGKLLQEKTRYLDLQTRKPKKVKEGDFMDIPPEVYAKTSNLPFYALLKKRR
ncbi:MAG: hypothetical protein H0W99_15510 [Acidobacteria bacterium]|nr:hypothetical protein [Acidobacteriota bacterium]